MEGAVENGIIKFSHDRTPKKSPREETNSIANIRTLNSFFERLFA